MTKKPLKLLLLTCHALLCTLLLALPQQVLSQSGKLFDVNTQLSSNFTNQVFLDNDGFIWSVTRNGLNRYDGYQFRTFKKDPQRDVTMGSNYVNCMAQDKHGLIYLGMWGALQTFDGNQFRTVEVTDLEGQHIDCYVTCFLMRRNGDVLIGTSGFGLLKMEGTQRARQVGGAAKTIHTVEQLLEDSRGRLWILTRDEGLLCIDGDQSHTYFDSPTYANELRQLCETPDSTLYIGTSTLGLLKMKDGAVETVSTVGRKQIVELYVNSRGEVMIGTNGAGISIYDPKTGSLVQNPYYSMEVDLSQSKVYSITEDAMGNIWMGLLQKGIYMQPTRTSPFYYMGYKLGKRNVIGQACVLSCHIDSRGRCWVGTDQDGIYCLDHEQRLLKHFKQGAPATILSIAEGDDGRIWIGSYEEGFGYIDANAQAYHQYPQYTKSSGFSVATSKSGYLWVATMGQGLLRVNLKSGDVAAYTVQPGAASNHKLNSLANDYISKMTLSPDEKRVYCATTQGLCCYDIDKQSWTSLFGSNCLNYGTPARIVKEYDGRLWIGTNDGLYCYDLLKKTQKLYTTDHGLADNGVASIEQDIYGKLWIGTDHGLCCYDPKTSEMLNYYVDNGLQSNEFSDGASFTVQRGNHCVMLYGGVGGITWFKPEKTTNSNWTATVRLVSFIVNQLPVDNTTMSDSYHICDTTVIAANRFQLAHHDNTFTLQFSTLSYDNPEHLTYLYSINGEPFHRLQSGVNEITFTHLPPGTYRFRVKAMRNQAETPCREFTVIVHSPWYRSSWAYVVYLLALSLLSWIILQNHRRKVASQLRLQEHIHREEMSNAKLKFFMNISHEIRTPMTLIITPLLSLIKNEEDPQKRSVLETIKRNADRILNLINQMMDLRKIDKGQMQMHMRETDLVGFVNEIYTLFEHQAKAKHLDFTYEHDAERLPIWIDRQHFDKVVVNILSNAFKFTPSGGKIGISITHTADTATISISDNGEKIPEDKLEKIFERFYQSATSVNDRNIGTGIGLDLTRSLVELHHGEIKASNLTEGCVFTVTLPLGKDHLSPNEIATDEDVPSTQELLQPDIEESPADDAPAAISSPSRKPKLVIAEDDDEIRSYLESQLSTDYDLHLCANGREALTTVLVTKPDLVISDVMMPEMDGIALCTYIKTNPTTNYIPVILLTAKNRDEDKLAGLENGADAYLVKPFNMEILSRTILNLLHTYRLLQLKFGRNDRLESEVTDIVIKSPDEKLLERVMSVISENLSDSELSVDMIANQVGISRVHLHRKMKELTGQTPHDFIRTLRFKQAANLLANQGMNVTEVMYACGFSSSASFSTLFKKFYGISPRDYMKEHYKFTGERQTDRADRR